GVAIRFIWVDWPTPRVVVGELETRNFGDREAGGGAVLDVEDEDRESIHREELGPRGLEPSDDLPLGNGKRLEARKELAGPRAGADDQSPGISPA
ncbi:MAG: hypothetical protein ACR2I5_12265, partial [Candidatus Limnocylindria bacterium]